MQKNPHACSCHIQSPPALPDSKLLPAPSKIAAQNHLHLVFPGYVNSLQLIKSLGLHQLHLETSLNHTCSLLRKATHILRCQVSGQGIWWALSVPRHIPHGCPLGPHFPQASLDHHSVSCPGVPRPLCFDTPTPSPH